MVSLSLAEQLNSLTSARRPGGAQQLVARLFEEARDDVYRYLLLIGLHPPQAQEATQEVFLRLYTTLLKGVEIENPRAWIFRVAHNYGLKVRTSQNRSQAFDPALEHKLTSAEPDPERGLAQRERMANLYNAIEGLSEQQRRCLLLRMEGLRYPEIGEALGISPSTVGEFLRRALSRLQSALKKGQP
jgi:RNA polymerase sigma-70 factor, ECF subfamily